jgi:hypothetical protein
MRQFKKLFVFVYELLKLSSAARGSSDFWNCGKNASNMGIL